jgi:hypothetical protein
MWRALSEIGVGFDAKFGIFLGVVLNGIFKVTLCSVDL